MYVEATSVMSFCPIGRGFIFCLIPSINLDAYLVDDTPKNNPARVKSPVRGRGRGRGRAR